MRVGVFSVQSRTPRDGPGRGAAGLLVPGFLKGGAGCSFRKPQAASRKGHHAIASQAASRVIVIVVSSGWHGIARAMVRKVRKGWPLPVMLA
jgi:hypothetical protein